MKKRKPITISYNTKEYNANISISDTGNIRYDKTMNRRNVRYSTEIISGNIGLMCPNCYDYLIRPINLKNESTISIINNKYRYKPDIKIITANRFYLNKCYGCGKRNILMLDIDVDIIKTISILNKKGYLTRFCCSGHSIHKPYIFFKDEKILDYIDTLPISWYIDYHTIKTNMVYKHAILIRTDEYNYIEALYDIYKWATALPNISKSKRIK